MMDRPCRVLFVVFILGSFAVPLALRAAPALPGQDAPAQQADVLQMLRHGAQAMHEGRPAVAEQDFRQAIAAAPQLPDGYLGLGMSQLRQGKADDAVLALTKAIDLNPQTPGAHMFLGIAQYQMNKFDDAAAALSQEVNLQPDNAEALTWLGMAELAAGHPELATAPLDHAYALSPRDANVLDSRARAHTQVAQQCFQQLYKLDPRSWHVHRLLAETFSASKQPEQAIVEYKAALDEQPNNPDLYEALGDEYQRIGHSADALKAYEQQLKLNPHNPIALFNCGKIHIDSDEPALGIPLLQQALDAHASPAPTYYYLGLGYSKSGQYQQAEQVLEKSLAGQPSPYIEQNAWYALVRVYQRLNRPADSQHALDEFKRLKAASAATHTNVPAQ